MDGSPPDNLYLQERRRRLAAERTLDRTRHELSRAHSALVANADRLSLRYLSERETNVRLTDRQKQVMAERKEAAEKADRARRRLWHALEAMRDGFALFDASGRLVAANTVYLNLFDAASEIGPGATAEDMFLAAAEEGAFAIEAEDPDEWVAAQLDRWQQDQIGMQVLQTFDGRSIRFQDRRAPDGDIVSLAIDISDVQAREDSLAAARESAEQMALAKQAFLARMSHEMRTPMNGVLGLSEMLCDQDLDPEAKEYVRTIRDSAEALLVIVNDTLDVSRLEAGHLDVRSEVFDLEAMLCDCLRLAGAGKPAEGLTVALDYPLDAPVDVIGDGGRIRQIVMNLVGNGLKFTDAGHVVVRVTLSPDGSGARLTLDVQDTGPGIPVDQRAAVFEAFSQVEDGRPQKEGTGLGLTISKGLAERLGGDVAIVDGQEQGACFRLTLPLGLTAPWPDPVDPLGATLCVPAGTGIQGDVLAQRLSAAGQVVTRAGQGAELTVLPVGDGIQTPPPTDGAVIALGPAAAVPAGLSDRLHSVLPLPVRGTELRRAIADAASAQPTQIPPQTPVAPSKPRILIADDNATNRFLLERMLPTDQFELEVVEDGAQALAAYQATPPAIVLMDISMPIMDGFEATAAIKAHAAKVGGAKPQIIALTAHTGAEMTERLEAAGFVSHQTKPVRKDALLEAIGAVLDRTGGGPG
ncbi:hypothetical protein JANAI62_32540 [Jannaschia pagri]|uniref:histidine kinase n=1 Tax=Jannaschia pagri TaxID=2829797 RepID=A0ABQ4NQL2_9RHOB|nr:MULTISPECIES: ATP-binding protein [unclassified Jannaschia]GIT92796.1 hypothetical protein JANAI61_32540 [Jannaschia sp. AI_61]GIT96631.1 hypothetical protein JANAI62_32540 [Jannaschia sp. AI_62]